MKALDMSPEAIDSRLRVASDLSSLSPETRLDAKLDMSPEGIGKRLAEVSELLELCRALAGSKPID